MPTWKFSFLLCLSLSHWRSRELDTTSRGGPWRCYDWPESLPTLPPRGWKSSPSQLVVVRWPDHYKKKLLEALEKHLLSWQEPMTSALPSPFLPFLMHMDCPGLVGHFIISEGKRQTAETHPDILERMVNTNHYPYPNFIKCGKQLPGWVLFFFFAMPCVLLDLGSPWWLSW